jgi:hypothetical protein
MRMSVQMVIVLAFLPIACAVAGFFSAHFILSAPDKVEWRSLGAPPGGAMEFVDKNGLVRSSNGRFYWVSGNEWYVKSDQVRISVRAFDENCPPVVPPNGTIDLFQYCKLDSDEYYAIDEYGTVWFYRADGDGIVTIAQLVEEFIVKVLASVLGLALGVGILTLVGIAGRFVPDE